MQDPRAGRRVWIADPTEHHRPETEGADVHPGLAKRAVSHDLLLSITADLPSGRQACGATSIPAIDEDSASSCFAWISASRTSRRSDSPSRRWPKPAGRYAYSETPVLARNSPG